MSWVPSELPFGLAASRFRATSESGPRQALLQREEHQLAPMVEVQLMADVAHVVAHRLRANGAVTGDLLCASTARDPRQDVPFALAQSGSGGKAARLTDRRANR